MRKIGAGFVKKKKIIMISIIFLCIISIIIIFSLYMFQKGVRDWIDIYIFRKNLTDEDTQIINLNIDKSNQIHVYGNNIAILNDKSIILYNSYGEKITTMKVDINTGIFDSANKYLVIAEKEGNDLCLLLDKTYLWSESLEGKILQVHVNRNGYVAVVTTDVTHKSILTIYNSEGKKLFTSYFASTRIVDVTISNDNKYIAIGELDFSGSIVQSNVKIISVENAQRDSENTVIYTYNAKAGDLITNVEYHDKGQISLTYDSGVGIIMNQQYKEILHVENDNITYISNTLKNHIVYVEEESMGPFKNASNVKIINSSDNQEIKYKIDEIAKEIYANDNVIAINAGTEIYFINTLGWLLKKYTATQEITNVKFSDDLAAIIYKDKVVLVDL